MVDESLQVVAEGGPQEVVVELLLGGQRTRGGENRSHELSARHLHPQQGITLHLGESVGYVYVKVKENLKTVSFCTPCIHKTT